MKRYYPVFFDIENRPCLVVGGGAVAAQKTAALLECGAHVTVISPELSEDMTALVQKDSVRCLHRTYQPDDVEGYALAICATDDARVNRQVFEEAESRNIPVNVVDVPALCRFIVPSALRQGDLCIAVSTGGKSPALARKIRRELEAQFGPEYATLLELLGRYRSRMKARFPEDFESRARAWEYLVASDLLDLIREGKVDEAEHRVATCISH